MPVAASLRDASTQSLTAGVVGVAADLWSAHAVCLVFRGKLVGGIPKDPALIEGWLCTRAGIDDPSLLHSAVPCTLEHSFQSADAQSAPSAMRKDCTSTAARS